MTTHPTPAPRTAAGRELAELMQDSFEAASMDAYRITPRILAIEAEAETFWRERYEEMSEAAIEMRREAAPDTALRIAETIRGSALAYKAERDALREALRTIAYPGLYCPWCGTSVNIHGSTCPAFIARKALAALPTSPPALDVERLKAVGFEPDFNVCRTCHHHGGDHDLNNRCLICGDYFTSMSKDEQWAWGAAEYARLAEQPKERG